MKRSFATQCLAIVLALSFAVFAATNTVVPLPQPAGRDFFPPEQDIQLGKQNSDEVAKQMPLLPDNSPVTEYVRSIGKRLEASMPQPTWPYTFHVVAQKDINAFALPGGPVYVNLGTIQAADNEAQLAGVLAHEMSHVYERHSTKQASKQMMAQVPLGILGAILGNGVAGTAARLGLAFGANSLFLKYSQSDEAQADEVGARIMYNAGYNPVQLAEFFRKIEEQGGSTGMQFLSDHPNPGNRVAAVSKEISDFPQKNFENNSAEFNKIHKEALNTKSYSAEQIAAKDKEGGFQNSGVSSAPGATGDVSTGPAPDSNFQTFDHRSYRIQYPGNWKVFGDRQSAVTVAPPSGISRNAVAVGAIISAVQPESNNLDEGTHQLISELKQSNPDLRTIGNDETIRVNGVQGKSVDMIGKSPIDKNGQPERERDWLVTLPRHDGSLMYMVFICPDSAYNQYRPTFEKMLRSIELKQ